MQDAIRFTVPGIPVSQPRQRSRVVTMGGRNISQNYTPTKAPVNAYKAMVQLAASNAFGNRPLLDGPLSLAVLFRLERKKCNTKKRGDNPPLYATKKPDLDNLMKSLCDALNGVVWKDDVQVCEVSLVKVIHAASEAPGVDVEIRPIANDTLAEAWRQQAKLW